MSPGWSGVAAPAVGIGQIRGPVEERKSSFKSISDQVGVVLDEMRRRGVAWEGTRFAAYRELWREASFVAGPTLIRWRRDLSKQQMFLEAAHETMLLTESFSVWPLVDAEVLKRKLSEVVQGPILPPADQTDDHGRDTLLELMSAAMLRRNHFEVTLTSQDADIVATASCLAPFAVECKRPVREATIERALRRANEQLKRRYESGLTHGIAVLGISRVLGLGGNAYLLPDRSKFEQGVRKMMDDMSPYLGEMATRIGMFPKTLFVAWLLTATAFVRQSGIPWTATYLGMRCTGSDADPLVRDRVAVVQRMLTAPPRVL